MNTDEQDLFNLINEARTDPNQFLIKYYNQLKSNQQFVNNLKNGKPICALAFHEGLYKGAEKRADGNLNPDYEGSFCMVSGGFESGTGLLKQNIDLVKSYSTNVLNPDYTHIGIAYKVKEKSYKLSIYWAQDNSIKKEKVKFVFQGEIDSSHVDFKKINTAKNENYLTDGEKQMIQEINYVRCYPKVYADIIRKEISAESSFWGGIGYDSYIAVQEILLELDTANGFSKPLNPKECIYKAAKLHGKDQTLRGFTAHDGTNGSKPWERIKRQCPEMKNGNENLTGGGNGTARAAVIRLLIDDGIPGRGHRYNLLDPKWTHVACFYNGKVGQMPDCWIQNFANF